MLKRLFFAQVIIILAVSLHAQVKKDNSQIATKAAASGYNINATITPLKNCWIHMGCYFGKGKSMVDSAWVDNNSKMVFKGDKKLPGGIYFMFIQNKSMLFEFLMDDRQSFNISVDTSDFSKVTVTGSLDNDIFRAYTDFLTQKGPKLNALQAKYREAKTDKEKADVRAQLVAANKELADYRNNVISKQPNSMMAMYFNFIKYPEVPEKKVLLPDGKIDSLYPWRYMKEHFWDGVMFNDNRLVYAPFFDSKVDEYFKYYVAPVPDSIFEEVNYILLSARTGKDIYKYLLSKFTDKYMNPEIMGQDKVFLMMYNQFFAKGDTALFNVEQRKTIFDRAYSIMANQIGDQAPPLDLIDSAGRRTPMYSLKSQYTLVVFWDPNCGHCKTEIPRVDSIYNAKWHNKGVKVYAVNTDDKALPAWKTYIKEHKLNEDGWVHVYQPREEREADAAEHRANYKQLYDVFQTPTLYLLDKEKRIIAKKLSIEQFDDLMEAKTKAEGDSTKN